MLFVEIEAIAKGSAAVININSAATIDGIDNVSAHHGNDVIVTGVEKAGDTAKAEGKTGVHGDSF